MSAATWGRSANKRASDAGRLTAQGDPCPCRGHASTRGEGELLCPHISTGTFQVHILNTRISLKGKRVPHQQQRYGRGGSTCGVTLRFCRAPEVPAHLITGKHRAVVALQAPACGDKGSCEPCPRSPNNRPRLGNREDGDRGHASIVSAAHFMKDAHSP